MNSLDAVRERKISELVTLFHQGDMNAVIPEAVKLISKFQSGTAYNILALAHKKLGNYEFAQSIYEQLLVDNPSHEIFLGNLGNIYSDTGKLDKAEECFKKCLQVEPVNYEVSLGLANVYLMKSRLDEALETYQGMLDANYQLTTDQTDEVNYRIGEVYRKMGKPYFEQAIKHFSCSSRPLSSAHGLELIYRTKDQATFYSAEKKIIEAGELNPLLAAVQTHASIRYANPDKNLFCKNPFDFVNHSKLTSEEGFSDELVKKLLKIRNKLDAAPQALLNNGEQSAGNFLLSDDPAVQAIENIIINRIAKYRALYEDSSEGFIKNWPENSNLQAWIIDLKKGGSLGSHMHKLGWLSGSLYLKLDKPFGSSQGNIIFDLDGADYPTDSKFYPSKEFNIEKGDIVLFPSSIFHKTVPFESEENRITLAFDIIPYY
jgi:tetratricopeptide (TPR) repeat protein